MEDKIIKNFGFLSVLIIIVFSYENIFAQCDYFSDDGGRTYFYGCTEDGYQGAPPVSNPTITEYEIISEVTLTNFSKSSRIFGDANHNGLQEMYVPYYESENIKEIHIYEFDENMNFTIYDLPFYGMVWDIGDINNNGLTDIVVHDGDPAFEPNAYLRIYESPDYNSFPTNLIEEIVIPTKKKYFYATIEDIDEDGKKEILMSTGPSFGYYGNNEINIYEWDNNGLNPVWSYTLGSLSKGIHSKAVYDFDKDGKNEIVGTKQGYPYILMFFECTGDNQYQFEQSIELPEGGTKAETMKTNPDGGDMEICVGLNHNWYFYKYDGSNYYLWYNTNYPLYNSTVSLKQTTSDFDCDGFDEIFVVNYPYLNEIEYFNGEMNTTWVNEPTPSGINIYSYDINNDGRPNLIHINQNYIEMFYEDNRLLINSDITAPEIWNNNVVVTKNVNVSGQLQINPDLNIYISACGGSINVKSNGTITVGNGVQFFGYSENNIVNIEGAIIFADDVYFKAYDSFLWEGLKFNNSNLTISISDITFEKSNLSGTIGNISLQNSSFSNSFVNLDYGNININDGTFVNSHISVTHPADDSKTIEIVNTNFSQITDTYAVKIDNYPNFYFYNNSISNCNSGIFISNSGYGKGNMDILNNNIFINTNEGLVVYNSNVKINDNSVY